MFKENLKTLIDNYNKYKDEILNVDIADVSYQRGYYIIAITGASANEAFCVSAETKVKLGSKESVNINQLIFNCTHKVKTFLIKFCYINNFNLKQKNINIFMLKRKDMTLFYDAVTGKFISSKKVQIYYERYDNNRRLIYQYYTGHYKRRKLINAFYETTLSQDRLSIEVKLKHAIEKKYNVTLIVKKDECYFINRDNYKRCGGKLDKVAEVFEIIKEKCQNQQGKETKFIRTNSQYILLINVKNNTTIFYVDKNSLEYSIEEFKLQSSLENNFMEKGKLLITEAGVFDIIERKYIYEGADVISSEAKMFPSNGEIKVVNKDKKIYTFNFKGIPGHITKARMHFYIANYDCFIDYYKNMILIKGEAFLYSEENKNLSMKKVKKMALNNMPEIVKEHTKATIIKNL